MSLRSISLAAAMAGALSVPLLAQQLPLDPQPIRRGTPGSVGINYNIVAVRFDRELTPGPGHEDFPDAFNSSLYIARNADLVLIKPNGAVSILVDAETLNTGTLLFPNGACTDPTVSYDGSTVFFAFFEDPQDFNTQRDLSRSPAHIYKVDVVSKVVTQLTSGSDIQYSDTVNKINPQYAKFDLAPIEYPDGRLLFLSNREGILDIKGKFPAMRFFRMDADGSNVEPMENFTLGSCQHPFFLKDGRLVWTHSHHVGRRAIGNGNYPLMICNPDLSDFKSFAGMHIQDTAWHFTSQLSGGDVVTTAYYNLNNWGHGTIIRIPLDPMDPTGQIFAPTTPTSLSYNPYGNPQHVQPAYTGGNDHFLRLGERVVTPWTLGGSLSKDEASPNGNGKVTMPSGIPNGHMLAIFSPGNVNAKAGANYGPPHMKIAYMPNGNVPLKSNMTVIAKNPAYNYAYPKALVPYQQIYGIAKPGAVPDLLNDGSVLPAVLPNGSPFATMGTSSLYNRESDWPSSYTDGWDTSIVNNYSEKTAIFSAGQDTYAFQDSEIFAAQVVVDMSHVDTRYSPQGLNKKFKTHNNGDQVWAILGEIPVRKGTTLDAQGNPDTSYEVRVPADTPVHNRILDSNGITLTSEMTWHAPRPGERKNNCGGCHAHSNSTTPLDFAGTAASSLAITDFALQTPVINRDAMGNPTILTLPERAHVVEFFKDVNPVLQNRCVSCHGDSSPAGGLDLNYNAGSDNLYDRLAYDDSGSQIMGLLYPTRKHHQATRWVRKTAASQSLLAWKAYDERLDGRMDGDRSDDVDFGAAHAVPGITFADKRVLSAWIDLGCLVDTTEDLATVEVWDPYDDQMRPILVVQGIDWDTATAPLGTMTLGVYDLHSGIDPTSLTVVATSGATTVPFSVPVVTDGDVVSIPLGSLAAGQTWTITVTVQDLARKAGNPTDGNVARRVFTANL